MASIKPTLWAARREGTLNKFYTRREVRDVLIQEIGDVDVKRVIDLGAGEGSLSVAAVDRWPAAHVTTVDIDDACVCDLQETLAAAGVKRHDHHVADVLSSGFSSILEHADFDLAVCNPPFFKPIWSREFADILRAADFADACSTTAEATAEILFLAQNLRLIRDGGTIALIVPDGLATGWRAAAFRRALLARHRLRAVVQLPPYSFHDTEAYCFILIVTKGAGTEDGPVKLLRLDDQLQVSDPIWVDHRAAQLRLDFAYHFAQQAHPGGTTTLRALGAEVRRGSLSTVERRAVSFAVFHTGDFPAEGERVSLDRAAGTLGNAKLVVAEPGDILMARVDRDLHRKITLVASGRAPITDCVFRVRVPEQFRTSVFDALVSQEGRARIQAVTKGVGARLLGKGELLDLPLSIPSLNAAENTD